MVEFFIGMVTTLLVIGMCGASYMLGKRNAHKIKPELTLDEHQKNKQDELKGKMEGINKILQYDVSTAYKSKNGGDK